VRCSHCGNDNPPGTRLCTNCKFILRPTESAGPTRRSRSVASARRAPSNGLLARIEGSRLAALLVLVIVIVVVIASIFVYYSLHKDDPYLGLTLRYSYISPTDTSYGSVHVWGDVYNWGDTEGSGSVHVVISDENGHSESYSVDVGPVPPKESFLVDETFPWPYACSSTYDLTVQCAVDY